MIVPISLEELPRILEIEQSCYDVPWSDRMFQQEFSNPLGIARGYRKDDLVGYIFSWMIFEDMHINNVAVLPEERGAGIGAALLKSVLEEAKQRDGERVLLEVRPSNIHALKLYEKYGFEEVAVRKMYYHDTGEDGLILAKTL